MCRLVFTCYFSRLEMIGRSFQPESPPRHLWILVYVIMLNLIVNIPLT